ncbi:MAG: homoserine O-succinyltransferase [Pantoea sp.]|nr:homoserine O-succinyltransferase [Pantoea sp.]
MPIRIPDELPAVNFLRNENVFVMTHSRASVQEIRPLKVLVLNLMPKKIETENQFLRLLSNSPLQIDIQLLRIDSRESRNTPMEHLNNFYCNFDDIAHDNFDGLIVTGAPLGLVDFNDVAYWPQIQRTRATKLSGVYEHQTLHPHALLTRGFDDTFLAPHSRYADFPAQLIRDYTDLEIFAESELAGPYLLGSKDKRLAFVTGHPEYDVLTLAGEYQRDSEAGLNPVIPCNYFPQDNPALPPRASWRSHGNLLFSNWLNYYVYQITPYDLRHMNPTLE